MAARKLTLVTVESCTGGYIAHLLTKHPGSSNVFLGGAIPYSNGLKMTMLGVAEKTLQAYGAVSQETVSEMAQNAIRQYSADYSIAVSGIAGPGGGTNEKPVGTICMAAANHYQLITTTIFLSQNRIKNIQLAAKEALNMLLGLLHT